MPAPQILAISVIPGVSPDVVVTPSALTAPLLGPPVVRCPHTTLRVVIELGLLAAIACPAGPVACAVVPGAWPVPPAFGSQLQQLFWGLLPSITDHLHSTQQCSTTWHSMSAKLGEVRCGAIA